MADLPLKNLMLVLDREGPVPGVGAEVPFLDDVSPPEFPTRSMVNMSSFMMQATGPDNRRPECSLLGSVVSVPNSLQGNDQFTEPGIVPSLTMTSGTAVAGSGVDTATTVAGAGGVSIAAAAVGSASGSSSPPQAAMTRTAEINMARTAKLAEYA